jgi:uncharacterized protein YcaQ
MTSLSWPQVLRFRLRRQHLVGRAAPGSLVEVVRDVGGIQAQLFSAAQVALWTRVRDLSPGEVKRALWEDRRLVKTWSVRRTLHLLPAEDLPIYVGGLRRNVLRLEQGWVTRQGLSSREAEAMTDAILEALSDGPLTRRELATSVVSGLGSQARRWIEHSWGGLVTQACMRGLVCFGPNEGQKVTFVRCDRWLPNLEDVPAEEAENALLRRYLRGYGPATPRDFATWSGMRVQEVTAIWKRLEHALAEVEVEGDRRWLLREDLEPMREDVSDSLPVRLLPSFDVYLLGHRDKDHLVDETRYKQVYRKAGWLSPVILRDGRVSGVWSHEKRGRSLVVTVEPFGTLPSAVRREVEAEAGGLARFLGTSGEVVFA